MDGGSMIYGIKMHLLIKKKRVFELLIKKGNGIE